jgi:small-conductance mechanosensitive channel
MWYERLNEFSDVQFFNFGTTPLTIGVVVGALVLLLFFMIAAWLVGVAIKRIRQRTREGSATLYLTEKLLSYGLVLAGIFVSLSSLGLDMSSFAVFAGAIGIGLGLGLQGVVKEFVSGLVLISDRAVHIGDYIEMQDGTRGLVQEIGPRATRIRNNDHVYLLVPNSKLIENTVINWTLRGDTRRIHVPFSVAYGADKEKVRDAVLAAAHDVPFTLPDDGAHKTQVWMIGFGESALEFELVVWPSLDAVKRPKAMNAAYTWAIDDALRKAGVEIPYPQRDIRLRGFFGEEGDDALSALNLRRTPHVAPSAPATTTNDAAEDLLRPEPDPEPDADSPAEHAKH